MTPVFPSLQATNAFIPVPSDTVDVKDDANNPREYPFCFLHNPSTTDTIDVRVIPAGASVVDEEVLTDFAVTIAIPPGATCPLAVRRVMATTPTRSEGDLTAFVGKQR